MNFQMSKSEDNSELKRIDRNENPDFGNLYAKLLACLILQPDRKIELEEFFISITIKFCDQLYCSDLYDDLISTFENAVEIFPNSLTLLNAFGSTLVRLGKLEEAYKIVEHASLIDGSSLMSERNLDQIKDMLIPRWHFRMLNDHKRNMAFRNAILKQIDDGYNTVLDIGTGTGLLSLFASEGKYKSIIACDDSKTMAHIAQNVFRVNSKHDIQFLNINSLDIDISKFSKVSLIVTEIFDCGVFGENLINSIQHAASNLTVPEWSIVPEGVIVHITGIQSDYIFRKSRLGKNCETGLFSSNLLAHADDYEPYDTVDLKLLKDVKYLTETQTLYDLSLKRKDLKNYMISKKTIFLKCIEDGYIDAFAIWMTLKLDDENIISTSPHSNGYCCWDQAIFMAKQQLKVKKHDKICLNSYCEEKLSIEHNILLGNINSIPLPNLVIEFLNDHLYIKQLNEVFLLLNKNKIKTTNLLDLSPFPVLGLLLLKENKCGYLVCNECDSSIKIFIELVAKLNGINMSKIHFMELTTIDYSIKFDIIVFNWIQENGEPSDNLQSQVDMKKLLNCGGLAIPYEINLYGLLVESKWLGFVTKVFDSNVNDYRIAEFINKFQIQKHIDFKIEAIDYTLVSNTINFGALNLEDKKIIYNLEVPIIKDGNANAILYWYEIKIYNDIVYSTRHFGSYINNAAFIFDSKSMKSGESINLNITQSDGLLRIGIMNEK